MGGFGQATTTTIDAGMLVVDSYNPRPRALDRGASVTDRLNPSNNGEKTYEKLQKAVASC